MAFFEPKPKGYALFWSSPLKKCTAAIVLHYYRKPRGLYPIVLSYLILL